MFDVAILGSGMSGAMLGAILARNGARVLIVEDNAHPKFAIGESTIPGTSLMWRVLSARYRVPEIDHLSGFYKARKHIGSSIGVKRNFCFTYSRPGQSARHDEITQCIVAEIPYGPESHLYRQDVDAYLYFAALRHGAVGRQHTSIADVDIKSDRVILKSTKNEEFTARYLVDCGGLRSLLATKLELRDPVPRYKTHSRSLFTHMIGVRPLDEFFRAEGQKWRWHAGTLHHLFDGGWMWVIPFDNWKGATNPLCSVGLQLDPRRFPRRNIPPQQEFEEFISQYPTIAPQFRDARPVRDWVAIDRLQYSAKRCVGDRYALMIHAAGFIDPLFSRGLENTNLTVNALAWKILQALKDDDFSAQRFEYVERLQQALLKENDRLVNACYIAFSDFELWDAYFRIWNSGAILGAARMTGAFMRFLETGDDAQFAALDEGATFLGQLAADSEVFDRLANAATDKVEAVAEGKISSKDAARHIRTMLESSEIAPLFNTGFCRSGEPTQEGHSKYNILGGLRVLNWGRNVAPPSVRKSYFDFKQTTALREAVKTLLTRI